MTSTSVASGDDDLYAWPKGLSAWWIKPGMLRGQPEGYGCLLSMRANHGDDGAQVFASATNRVYVRHANNMAVSGNCDWVDWTEL